MTRYKGGCFNLKYGRNPRNVIREVKDLLDTHRLDFLVVGEARDYFHELQHIAGYDYYTSLSDAKGAQNDGILVKSNHHVTKFKAVSIGDGWTTVTGAYHGPSQMPEVTINGELKVKAVHAVTPTHWVKGKLTGPKDRIDDYMLMVKHLNRWFWWPCRRVKRICLGDWNERPFTEGTHSPKDIAEKNNAFLAYPTNSREGHGIIDYAMCKGVVVHQVFKDTRIEEGSDHEPVIITFSV